MAVIQLRGQFNDQGFKGLVNNPHDRKAAVKKLAEALGFNFLIITLPLQLDLPL